MSQSQIRVRVALKSARACTKVAREHLLQVSLQAEQGELLRALDLSLTANDNLADAIEELAGVKGRATR